jgi:glycosyltransferase involved in cell wall biosynthesis
MKVVIFEPDHGGHRLSGVRVLADALLEVTDDVTLVTSEDAQLSPEFEVQIKPLLPGVKVIPVPFSLKGTMIQFARRRIATLLDVLHAHRFDHLYVPYADGVAQLLGMRRFNPLARQFPKGLVAEGLMMRGVFGYPGVPAVKRWMSLRSMQASPFERLHLIDPIPYKFIQKNRPAALSKVSLLADPIECRPGIDRRLARRNLGIPEDGRIVGCIGFINTRKGSEILIRAFLDAKLARDDRLLLAGKFTQPVRDFLSPLDQSRIIRIDRYLSEPELEWATSAVDLMATPYPGFVGSASLCIRAAVAGRMCLGADTGWMQYVLPTFGLGSVCDVLNHSELVATLERTLPQSVAYRGSEQTAKLARFYSIDNVRAGWTALIRQRMGLPPRAGSTAWPD